MATATATVTRFHPPKSTIFPMYMKKQRTVSMPEIGPRNDTLKPSFKIHDLAWSAFGTQIATSTSQKSIRVWDPEKTKSPVAEFMFRGDKAEKVLYHPNGE